MKFLKADRQRPATRRPGAKGGISRWSRLIRWSPRSHSGFTLVETVVALAVLSVAVLAVAASLLFALKSARRSRSLTQAMYLVEQQLEIFHLMTDLEIDALLADLSYPNDPDNPIDPDPGDADTTQFTRSWTIQPDTPEVGVYTLAVHVVWADSLGINRTTTVQTLKADF